MIYENWKYNTIVYFKKIINKGHFQKSLFLILMSWFTSFCKNLQQMLSIEVICHMCSCRMIRSLTSHSRFQFIILYVCYIQFFSLSSYVYYMTTSCKDTKISGWLFNFLPRACLVVIRKILMFCCEKILSTYMYMNEYINFVLNYEIFNNFFNYVLSLT